MLDVKKAKCNIGQGWMLVTVRRRPWYIHDNTKAWWQSQLNTPCICLAFYSSVCCPYVVSFSPQTTLYGRHFVPICRCERPRLNNCFAQGYRACVWGAPLGPGFLAVPISQLMCPGSRCFTLVLFSLYSLKGSIWSAMFRFRKCQFANCH